MNLSSADLFYDLNGTWGSINWTSRNVTQDDGEVSKVDLAEQVVVSCLLVLMILGTVVGNIFVIAAIVRERVLQTVGNSLVLSLAVADLLVALLVMPPGAVYEVMRAWTLGPVLCEVWTACDVLCCTASILHLVAIATDRYWAVTRVDYVRERSLTRVGTLIAMVWVVAIIVSLLPVLGWKDAGFQHRIEVDKRCIVSQDPSYQVFATCSTFYAPLVAILILYWRIYIVARTRIRHKPGAKRKSLMPGKTPTISEMTTMSSSSELTNNGLLEQMEAAKKSKRKRKETLESKRERKAAKTLAIITGVFVICWLPFFAMALLMALCTCEPNEHLFSFFLWLGYVNSMLNPIIYTIFSPDFRNAFKKILCTNGQRSRSC